MNERKEKIVNKQNYTIDDLLEIIRLLRDKDGCPWDKVQTHQTLRMNMIEESYELVDAIDKNDDAKMCEETGDVLLQAVFHACLAEERSAFTLNDAIDGICKKLIFRHSHVFGEDVAKIDTEALSVWDKNKRQEKGFNTASEYVSDLPKNFPALLRAEKAQKRVAKYGLDFENVNQIYDKIAEETLEVKNADEKNRKEEIGDLLFSVVNLARFYGVDAEESLKESTEKFIKRFTKAESKIVNDKKEMTKLSPKEWDKYYNETKKD